MGYGRFLDRRSDRTTPGFCEVKRARFEAGHLTPAFFMPDQKQSIEAIIFS
jgi:hypothetical protein